MNKALEKYSLENRKTIKKMNADRRVNDRIWLLETLIKDSVKYQVKTNTKHVLNLINDLDNEINDLVFARYLHGELVTLAETVHRDNHSEHDTREVRELTKDTLSDIDDEAEVSVYADTAD